MCLSNKRGIMEAMNIENIGGNKVTVGKKRVKIHNMVCKVYDVVQSI